MTEKNRSLYRKNQDIYYVVSLTLLCTVLVVTIMLINQSIVWGSKTDWLSQHFTIPEYFRTRFYKTGELFPDFSAQLGGGQNIYNMSYYGLMNPIYLPAYLMPWVNMADYIQVVSLLSVIISSIMCYFLMKKHFTSRYAFILAIMFMCSAPILFHSHRHIMFVNYFPFLFWSLLAINKGDSIKSRAVIIFSAYCIICSSFYYSISSFSVILIYSAFLFLKNNSRFSFRKLVKYLSLKILCIILGCATAAVLWLPTFATLLSGRAKGSSLVNTLKLLIPTVNLQYMLYSSYSMGTTFITIVAVIVMLRSKDKASKLLAIVFSILVCCPIIIYAFNGAMYIDAKILIPFLPLLMIVCGEFFETLFANEVNILKIAIILAAVIAAEILFNDNKTAENVLIIVNAVLVIAIMLIFSKTQRRNVVLIPIALCSIIGCIVANVCDTFVTREEIESVYSEDVQSLVDKTTASDGEFYRFANNSNSSLTVNSIYGTDYYTPNIYSSVSNSEYRNFRFNGVSNENSNRNNAIHSQSKNEIFNVIMNCKYRISKSEDAMFGESIEDKSGDYYLFSNENTLPTGYASYSILNEENYNKLGFAEQAEALLENIIVPGSSSLTSLPNNTKRLTTGYSISGDTSFIKEVNRAYEINSKNDFSLTVNLNESVFNRLIMLKFKADNRIGKKSERNDISVSINGVKNKLSAPDWKYNNKNYDFSYVLSSDEPIEKLVFDFSKGNYMISEIEAYTLDGAVFENAMSNKDEFVIDREEMGGDTIVGDINVTKDGWFNISVPYDKGFDVYVDGVKTEYFKTNTAFIGFPISQGRHNIQITYTAPLKVVGVIITIISCGTSVYMLATMWLVQYRRELWRRRIMVTSSPCYSSVYYGNSVK